MTVVSLVPRKPMGILEELLQYCAGRPCTLLMEQPGINYEHVSVGRLTKAERQTGTDAVHYTFEEGEEDEKSKKRVVVISTHNQQVFVVSGDRHSCSGIFIAGEPLARVVNKLAPYHPA